MFPLILAVLCRDKSTLDSNPHEGLNRRQNPSEAPPLKIQDFVFRRGSMRVVVKIMVPFLDRHLMFRVPQKGS